MNKLLAGAVAGLCFGAFSMASAQDLSAGLSLGFASDFAGQGFKYDSFLGEISLQRPWTGFAFNAYFDATYAEADVGMTFGSGKDKATMLGMDLEDENSTGWTFLNLGLLGKYPVAVSETFSIAPAVGIDYALCLGISYDGEAVEFEDDEKAGDYSQLWVKFGAIADFALTDAIYFRPALLYGIGFASKYYSDEAKDMDGAKANLSHGLTLKVGVGYKF